MTHPGPTDSASRLGVIILGAGASSRMGQPKLLLPWNGTTIIGHLIRQWQALGATQISVVCRSNDEPLLAELERLGFPRENRILNPQPERGMFSSIQCAAHWPGWQPDLTSWAIVLGDQPHLHSETLQKLLAFHARHSIAICQPSHEGHAGHPVLLPRSAFEQLQNTGAQTLKTFLKQNDAAKVKCPVTDSGLALDLDTPEDYKRATSNTSGT
jgi:molybdenum cofactor cytidylyltransferase